MLRVKRRENSETALAGKQNPSDSAPRKLEGEEEQTVVLSRAINVYLDREIRPISQKVLDKGKSC